MVKIDIEFEKAFNSFMGTKNLDSKTKEKYLFFYHKLINLYPELNQKNIDNFLEHNNSSPARAMVKNLIRSIVRWEFPDELKKEIGSIDIPDRTAKVDKKEPKFLRKSDIDILDIKINSGDSFKDERIKLMILTQFYAGLRINELINLNFISLNKEQYVSTNQFQEIKISSESAKFGKERNAYIPTFIYVRIIKWIQNDVLMNYKDKSYDKNKNLWNIGMNRYRDLLDKYTREILGEHYNSHSLRHGRGYNLIVDEHKPIEFVKKYLGHSDIQSTQIYTHLGDKEIKEELESTSNI
jgi:integrase